MFIYDLLHQPLAATIFSFHSFSALFLLSDANCSRHIS